MIVLLWLFVPVLGNGPPGIEPPASFHAESWYPSNLPTVFPPWKVPGVDIELFRTTENPQQAREVDRIVLNLNTVDSNSTTELLFTNGTSENASSGETNPGMPSVFATDGNDNSTFVSAGSQEIVQNTTVVVLSETSSVTSSHEDTNFESKNAQTNENALVELENSLIPPVDATLTSRELQTFADLSATADETSNESTTFKPQTDPTTLDTTETTVFTLAMSVTTLLDENTESPEPSNATTAEISTPSTTATSILTASTSVGTTTTTEPQLTLPFATKDGNQLDVSTAEQTTNSSPTTLETTTEEDGITVTIPLPDFINTDDTSVIVTTPVPAFTTTEEIGVTATIPVPEFTTTEEPRVTSTKPEPALTTTEETGVTLTIPVPEATTTDESLVTLTIPVPELTTTEESLVTLTIPVPEFPTTEESLVTLTIPVPDLPIDDPTADVVILQQSVGSSRERLRGDSGDSFSPNNAPAIHRHKNVVGTQKEVSTESPFNTGNVFEEEKSTARPAGPDTPFIGRNRSLFLVQEDLRDIEQALNQLSTPGISSTTTAIPTSTPVLTTTTTAQECSDLLFVLDSSGNVKEQYEKQKVLIRNIINRLRQRHRRFGLVTFASRSRQRWNIPIRLNIPVELFLKKMERARFLAGVTATGSALAAVARDLSASRRPTTVVVVSDGFSFDSVQRPAQLLRSLPNVRVFTTGNYFPIVRHVLETISGRSNVRFGRRGVHQLIDELQC